MREEGLQGRQRGAYRPRTTDSNHDGPIAPNRLAQVGPITACDQVWQTDITYLPTRAGWLYLAVVLDAHSKRVLGWAFSPSLGTGFVILALLMAIRHRGADVRRASCCTPTAASNTPASAFAPSSPPTASPPPSAVAATATITARAEAFFSTLKIELVYRHDFQDRDHARRVVFEWIEAFYNLRRRHSSIGHLSPVDFENQKN